MEGLVTQVLVVTDMKAIHGLGSAFTKLLGGLFKACHCQWHFVPFKENVVDVWGILACLPQLLPVVAFVREQIWGKA